MARSILIVMCSALLMGLASCPSYIGAIFDEKISEWKAANSGAEPDKETLARLYAEARTDAAEADEWLGRSAGQVATGVATGNWFLVVLGVLGIVTVGGGAYAKLKEKKT